MTTNIEMRPEEVCFECAEADESTPARCDVKARNFGKMAGGVGKFV